MNEPSAVTKVARDLTEIVGLQERLMVQAINKAGAQIDGHSLPGGAAMVNLAGVADRETNERRVELHEEKHLRTCLRLDHSRCWTGSEDEDDTEPVLQTLLFWSEQWRTEHGFPLEGRRPTIATESNLIRSLLDWAWSELVEWEDFARDISSARTRLENLLRAGARSERGVPCLYSECRGKRLVRKLVPTSKDGYKVWVMSDWHCTSCKRKWDEDRYAAMVAAAHWDTQSEQVGDELWCSVKYAARTASIPETTIRAWISQTKKQERPVDRDYPIVTACLVAGRREGFVCLDMVLARRDRTRRSKEDAA